LNSAKFSDLIDPDKSNDFRVAGGMTELDRIDYGILGELQKNVRLANKELAAAVGIAPSTCHERVKRLWELGVLVGAHAEVEPRAFGVGLEALLFIELSKHERANVDSFMSEVVDIPEVRTAFLITGRHDLVVHVVARDTVHLKDLALDRFTNRPGVTRIETSIIYESKKRAELKNLK
jgi:DNA-binding Lrp family transcriptional regulator